LFAIASAHAQTATPAPTVPLPTPAPVLVTKAPVTAPAAAPASTFQFPYSTSGWYAGIGTLGGGGSVSVSGANLNQNSLVSNQIGIYGTVGRIWNVGTSPMFMAIDLSAGKVNFNGSAPGLSFQGPADFETRFLVGAPIDQIAAFFPSLGIQVPTFAQLPAGFTAKATKFYLGAAVHISDDTLSFYGAKSSVWGVSPTIIPAGVLVQLTNGSVADFSSEVRLNDRGLCTTAPIAGSACGRPNVELLAGVKYLFGI
jgi:hypothetical protein